MTDFEKLLQIVTAAVAAITFVWGIVNVFITFRQNKKIANLQGRVERGNYVSRIVFDKIFKVFEDMSETMFECYNIAGREMFPYYEDAINSMDNPQYDMDKMIEVEERARIAVNKLVVLQEVNRFILSDALLTESENFEKKMKVLIRGYAHKITEQEDIPQKEQEDMLKFAEELQTDYKSFTARCHNYVQGLQIVE